MKHFSFFTNGSMKERRLIFMAEKPDAQPNPEAENKRLQEENKLLREQLDTTNKNLDRVVKLHEELLKKIDASPYLPRQDASGVPYIPALENSPMMSSPAARNVIQQQLRARMPNVRDRLPFQVYPEKYNMNAYSPRMRRAPRKQVVFPDRKNYDGQRRQFFTVPKDEYGEPIRLPNGEYARVYGETVGDVAARLRATQPMMMSDSQALGVLARYNRNRGSFNEGVYRFRPYEPIGGVKLPSATDMAYMEGVNGALRRGLVPMGGNYFENPNLVRGRKDQNGNWYDAGPQFREQFSARTGWNGERFEMGLDENNEITYYPVEATDASMIGMNSIPAARGSRSEQDQIRSFNAGLDKEKIETGYDDLAKSTNPDVKRVYGEVMQRLSENMRKYSGDRREIESQYQLARTRLDQLRKNAFEMNSNAEVQGKALRTVERGVTKFAGDSYFTIEYEEAGTLKKITIRDPRIWGIGMFVGPESMDLAKEQGIRVSQKTLSTGKVNGIKIEFTKPGSFKLTSVNGSASQQGTEVIDIKSPTESASAGNEVSTPKVVPPEEYSPRPIEQPKQSSAASAQSKEEKKEVAEAAPEAKSDAVPMPPSEEKESASIEAANKGEFDELKELTRKAGLENLVEGIGTMKRVSDQLVVKNKILDAIKEEFPTLNIESVRMPAGQMSSVKKADEFIASLELALNARIIQRVMSK